MKITQEMYGIITIGYLIFTLLLGAILQVKLSYMYPNSLFPILAMGIPLAIGLYLYGLVLGYYENKKGMIK